MSHEFLTEPIHTTESKPFSDRCRRLFSSILLQALVLTLGANAFGAGQLRAQSNQDPSYAFTLKSGYLTAEPGEKVRVLITDAKESDDGVAVVVRFFDRESILLDEIDGETLPGDPFVAEFRNDTGQQALIRLELDLLSDDQKVVPITTIEVDHPNNLTATQRYSCSGPLVREPVEYSCGDGQICPPPPPPSPLSEFNCPELSHFPSDL